MWASRTEAIATGSDRVRAEPAVVEKYGERGVAAASPFPRCANMRDGGIPRVPSP